MLDAACCRRSVSKCYPYCSILPFHPNTKHLEPCPLSSITATYSITPLKTSTSGCIVFSRRRRRWRIVAKKHNCRVLSQLRSCYNTFDCRIRAVLRQKTFIELPVVFLLLSCLPWGPSFSSARASKSRSGCTT